MFVLCFCILVRHLSALISSSMMISGIFKVTPSIAILGDFQNPAGEGPDQSNLSLNLSLLMQGRDTRDLQSPFQPRLICDFYLEAMAFWP